MTTRKEAATLVRIKPDSPNELIWLDEGMETMEQLLLDPQYAELPVSVISISGALRGGKSFFLDQFLIPYLRQRSHEAEQQTSGAEVTENQWSSNSQIQLEWRGGREPCSQGIQLWPEPFVLSDGNGGKVLVLVMDTQGLFDDATTDIDWARLFALSTAISSVQLFNVAHNGFNTDCLGGVLKMLLYMFDCVHPREDVGAHKPSVQSFGFLVRDTPCDKEKPFGLGGGEQLLHYWLKKEQNQGQQQQRSELLRDISTKLAACFDDLFCCTLPRPSGDVMDGIVRMQIAAAENTTGLTRADLGERFYDEVHRFLPHLVDRALWGKLTADRMGRMNSAQLFDHIKELRQRFSTAPSYPSLDSFQLLATYRLNDWALNQAKMFLDGMLLTRKPYLKRAKFNQSVEQALQLALYRFKNRWLSMEGVKSFEAFGNQLFSYFLMQYPDYCKMNKANKSPTDYVDKSLAITFVATVAATSCIGVVGALAITSSLLLTSPTVLKGLITGCRKNGLFPSSLATGTLGGMLISFFMSDKIYCQEDFPNILVREMRKSGLLPYLFETGQLKQQQPSSEAEIQTETDERKDNDPDDTATTSRKQQKLEEGGLLSANLFVNAAADCVPDFHEEAFSETGTELVCEDDDDDDDEDSDDYCRVEVVQSDDDDEDNSGILLDDRA